MHIYARAPWPCIYMRMHIYGHGPGSGAPGRGTLDDTRTCTAMDTTLLVDRDEIQLMIM
jgi:hypothetical protein